MNDEHNAYATSVGSSGETAVQAAGGELAGAGSLDKVREILFGSQAREYDKRLAGLELRIAKEAADLRADLKRRFDSLETYIKGEIESLTGRLKSEQNERQQTIAGLSNELKELLRNADRRTSELDESVSKSNREFRQQLLDQSKALGDEIRQKHDELQAALEREAGTLRDDKTDRAALAAMFTELALRLRNEFKLPGVENLGNG